MKTAAGSVVVRPVQAQDEEFLFALFRTTRGGVIAMVPVEEEQRAALLRMQFAAQQRSYAARFTEAGHSVVMVDGRLAGRLWTAESGEAIHIVDIVLLPEYRGCGIGERLYRELMARAASSGRRVASSVSTANPGSQRFHERLGFRVTGGDGMFVQMEWEPAPSLSVSSAGGDAP